MNDERKLIRPWDIAAAAVILAAAAAVYFLTGIFSAGDVRAVIVCGGETAAVISLDRDGEYSFSETGGMVFTVREGKISVTESDCHDKICMRTGSVSRAREAIICVPNRTAVTLESDFTLESGSEESGVDVVLR